MATLIGFCHVQLAFAQTISGNDLLSACETAADAQQGFCVGYIIGANEGLRLGAATAYIFVEAAPTTEEINNASDLILGWCALSEVENGQLKDVVVGYLQNHPEIRHESARSLIRSALVEAFPCQ